MEWMMAERVTWTDKAAEHLKRRALDAWEDRQLAAFWARNPRPQKHERLKVEVGTVHDAHGSIPDHCAAALHLPKVCCANKAGNFIWQQTLCVRAQDQGCCILPSRRKEMLAARDCLLPWQLFM